MNLRALLFVPGDRPDRMGKALNSGADALILDLEDSVMPGRKAEAREHVTAFLGGARRDVKLLVRVNPLRSDAIEADLAAVLGAGPDGIVLPKCERAEDVTALVAQMGVTPVPILPIATETPAAVFGLGTYADVSQHLLGLTWGAEDLPSAIGATTSRLPDGTYTPPYGMIRSLALFAAHAAGVAAIDTVYPDFADLDGLATYARAARRDGFAGMMAIHPSQVPVINAAMTPSTAERDHAERVLAAFAAQPEAGAVQLDGRMLDRPHLLLAKRLLGQ